LALSQEAAMKYVIYVFYLEIIANLFLIVQCLFFPAGFLAQFSASQAAPAFALEVARWYGVLLIPIVWLLFRALQSRGKVLKLVLEAYLVFDLVQIVVALVSAKNLGWMPYVVMALGIEVVLATARILCLWKPLETGLDG
jgi:hypothetical protein